MNQTRIWDLLICWRYYMGFTKIIEPQDDRIIMLHQSLLIADSSVFWNYGIRAFVMKLPQHMFFQAAGYNQTVTRYGMLNTER
jgi:hypothetical protein